MNKLKCLSIIIMTLLGIPRLLQMMHPALGGSNPRSYTSLQGRKIGCHTDKHAILKVLISIPCPWRVTIIPFTFLRKLCICNSNSLRTQIHFWGNYIFLLLLFFWINKLQTTPLLPEEKSLTAPDGRPSQLNTLSYFTGTSLVGWHRPPLACSFCRGGRWRWLLPTCPPSEPWRRVLRLFW